MSAREKNHGPLLKFQEKGLYKTLRAAAEAHLSDNKAFEKVEREAHEALRRLVLGVYHNIQRGLVRAIEQDVDKKLEVAETPNDRFAAREALSGELFFTLADGTYVRWGKATPEQHYARAVWQRQLAGKCTDDALRHEQAAEEIIAAGVTCLDEIKNKRVR